MIALKDHTFGCPHCQIELRLRQGAEHSSGACPNCGGWLHAPRKMAVNSSTSRVRGMSPDGSSGLTGAHLVEPAPSSFHSPFNTPAAAHAAAGSLPPRRDGTPPRLLGDHPAQIAQTSIPTDAKIPLVHSHERKAQVRALRRWDHAKMVALSLLVFGIIGGMIQWTKSVDRSEVEKNSEARAEYLKREEAKQRQMKVREADTALTMERNSL